MKKITILTMIIGVAIGSSACSFEFSTNGTNSSNKPANTANNASNAGNSNANKANTTSNADSKPKNEIKDEKATKPANPKKQTNSVTVPAEWVWYSDDVRGYGFSLPAGSSGESGKEGNVDTFVAVTPDDITVIVYAFKDASLTKEDLLDRAEKALNAMGETVTVGKLTGESEDYAVADADSVDTKGGKSKLKVLVATDVSDNYVMFVRSDDKTYDAKKATMDMIWGSFEMYSGGASGN